MSASSDAKKLRRMIRFGQLPRTMFTKQEDGRVRMRKVDIRRTKAGKVWKLFLRPWQLVSTLNVLLSDEDEVKS